MKAGDCVNRMKDEEIIKLLETLEPGAEIEIDIKALDGLVTLTGKFKCGLHQDGYYKGGSWINNKSDSDYWKNFRPCYQFYFQEIGKRKLYIMQVGLKVMNIRKI